MILSVILMILSVILFCLFLACTSPDDGDVEDAFVCFWTALIARLVAEMSRMLLSAFGLHQDAPGKYTCVWLVCSVCSANL